MKQRRTRATEAFGRFVDMPRRRETAERLGHGGDLKKAPVTDAGA
jgi:hypothetical protein